MQINLRFLKHVMVPAGSEACRATVVVAMPCRPPILNREPAGFTGKPVNLSTP